MKYPAELVVDMGAPATVNGFTYTASPDAAASCTNMPGM